MGNQQFYMTNDQAVRIKTGRKRGWLLMIFGILCNLWGICWLFWGIYGYFDPPQDFSSGEMLLPAIVIGPLSVMIGLLSSRSGIRKVIYANELMDTGEKVEYGMKHRKFAWACTLAGGVITFLGIFFAVLTIYNLVIIPRTANAIDTGLFSIQCSFLALLFGLSLLFMGSWGIVSAREINTYPNE